MMKRIKLSQERVVLFLTVVIALLYWCLEALVDSIFFTNESFTSVLISSIPPHELYKRLMTVATLGIFGITVSILLRKRNLSEQALQIKNRALNVLSKSNEALVKVNNELELLNEIAHILVSDGGYNLVWVGYAVQNDEKSVYPVLHAGKDSDFITSMKTTWGNDEYGIGPTGSAIRTGKQCISRYMDRDTGLEEWREKILERGCGSVISLPLFYNHEVIGALTIYATEPHAFDSEEVRLLGQLSDNLSYGIEYIRINESRKQAELELQRSESNLRAVFDNTHYSFILIDGDYRILTLNGIAADRAKMLYGRNAIEGECILDFINDEDHQIFISSFNQAIQGSPIIKEYKVKIKTGTYKWFEFQFVPVKDDNGDIYAVLFSIYHIHDRKSAEEKLQESEKRYRDLFNNSISGFAVHEIITDDTGNPVDYIFREVNNSFQEHTGLKRVDILNKRATEVIPGIESMNLIAVFGSVALSGGPVRFEEYIPPLHRYFEISAFSTKHGEFATIISDITARKLAEREVQRSQRLLSSTFNAIRDELIVIDRNYTIVMSNLSGNPEHNTRTRESGVSCYSCLMNRDIPCEICIPRSVFETGTPKVFETTTSADNRIKEVRVFPIFDNDGAVHMIVEHLRDVTEQKEYDERISKSLAEKELLLKEVHHRVKNNMQIISSMLSLQVDYIWDKRDAMMFVDSQNRIQSMALVHEKLYQSDDFLEIDLNEYIEELLVVLNNSYSVNSSRISYSLAINNIFLPIDTAIPVAQLINEIVSNSLKHAFHGRSEGVITVEIYILESGRYRIVIGDNGAGIPENIGLQGSRSLGMQIIQGLTKQLHGSIELSRDNGTWYTIEF